MKLSNKILIGFFGFIFVYMAAAFTEIRLRGTPDLDESNGITETVNLLEVNYLNLSDLGWSISVIGSENPRIEVWSISGDLLQNLKYEVAGDTLSVLDLELKENQSINISIYVKNTLRGITMDGTGVTVKELDQSELFVSQTGGWIRFQENNKLKNLTIKAEDDADFYFSGTPLDTLTANIDNSNVMIYSPSKHVQGAISNHGYLLLNDADQIEFKKDLTSRLNWN